MAKLEVYNDRLDYDDNKPHSVEDWKKVTEALEYAKKEVAKVRGSFKFKGFKIFTSRGELKYKLPSF